MLEKVLVLTDGSEHSDKATSFSAKLFKGSSCKVTLLIVVEEPAYPVMTDGLTPPVTTLIPYEEIREELLQYAEKVLSRCEAPLREAGLEVEKKVRFGHPVGEILKEMEEGAYEMIVAGSKGRHAVGDIILGSVSTRLTHHASCPILLVR